MSLAEILWLALNRPEILIYGLSALLVLCLWTIWRQSRSVHALSGAVADLSRRVHDTNHKLLKRIMRTCERERADMAQIMKQVFDCEDEDEENV